MVTRGKDVNTAHNVTNIRQYRPLYLVQRCRCWLLGPGDQRPWDRMWVGLGTWELPGAAPLRSLEHKLHFSVQCHLYGSSLAI